MNSLEGLRFEVLRLAKVGGNRVCIQTHQLCRVFNVSENLVRRELAKLAEEKLILLAGWDGRQIRDYTNWPSGEEFINSRLGAGHVHVALPDAGGAEDGLRAFAASGS
ncbi:MAG TPA: DeoR family transcriptional regulator [Methylomirabilota bacterium]|jgi:hypothetical protein|nr:DeoR family transcriptional regulator [Methylomirabilota bacterium]